MRLLGQKLSDQYNQHIASTKVDVDEALLNSLDLSSPTSSH